MKKNLILRPFSLIPKKSVPKSQESVERIRIMDMFDYFYSIQIERLKRGHYSKLGLHYYIFVAFLFSGKWT